MRSHDLLNDSPKKVFFSYLIPSISATFVTSLYFLADTIMIGHAIGEDGIAVLNLIIPLETTFFAAGLLFGVGGGVLMSIAKGRGNHSGANACFSTACTALLAVTALTSILGAIFFDKIAFFMGATQDNLQMTRDYGFWIVAISGAFFFSTFLQTFVRNDKAPKRAMAAVLTGAGLNIVLDYLFIYPLQMGMFGAGIATVIGSAVTTLLLCTHFFSPKNSLRFSLSQVRFPLLAQISHYGSTSFLMEASGGLTVFLFNQQTLRYIGIPGIVVYGILTNYLLIGNSLFNGVAQAAQPLLARNFGAGKLDRVHVLTRTALATTFVIGTVCCLCGILFPETLIRAFVTPTEETMALGKHALPIYFTVFIMMNFTIFFCSWFQAVMRPKAALILSIFRSCGIGLILLWLLPKLFGAPAIWFVTPITEAAALFMAVLFWRKIRPTLPQTCPKL